MTHERVKTTKKRSARAVLAVLVSLAALSAVATTTQAVPSKADITVEWDEDGMGVEVTSDQGLSNIIVLLCDGSAHKYEDEFKTEEDEDEVLTWSHDESQDIVAIWVKAGSNHDPEGPAPPAPFDNPGAGEYFENPFADCDGISVDLCIGLNGISARTAGETIVVSWSAFDDATGYNVYADGGRGFVLIATLGADETSYTDADVTAGDSITYTVTALVDGGETETDACDEVEITAIPVFPTVFAGAMAGIVGIGAYAFSRRRSV